MTPEGTEANMLTLVKLAMRHQADVQALLMPGPRKRQWCARVCDAAGGSIALGRGATWDKAVANAIAELRRVTAEER